MVVNSTLLVELRPSSLLKQFKQLEIEISNIVCTVDLERQFDLNQLSCDLPNSEYHPETTAFLVYRSDAGDSATILLPFNGNASIVGVSDKGVALSTFADFKYNCLNLGINILGFENNIVVQNLVLTGSLKTRLELEAIAIDLGLEYTEYEPEQFPGLIFRPDYSGTILLFSSGKFVLTGISNVAAAQTALEYIESELYQISF